jgi:hypothetical protein
MEHRIYDFVQVVSPYTPHFGQIAPDAGDSPLLKNGFSSVYVDCVRDIEKELQ